MSASASVKAKFDAVKVFSATKANDRDALGEKVTSWLKEYGNEVVKTVVTQSSDSEFHCLTITVFYNYAHAKKAA